MIVGGLPVECHLKFSRSFRLETIFFLGWWSVLGNASVSSGSDIPFSSNLLMLLVNYVASPAFLYQILNYQSDSGLFSLTIVFYARNLAD